MPNPGSYNEFLKNNNLGKDESALSKYSLELANYRVELAETRGMTTEELHLGPLVVGSVAMKQEVSVA